MLSGATYCNSIHFTAHFIYRDRARWRHIKIDISIQLKLDKEFEVDSMASLSLSHLYACVVMTLMVSSSSTIKWRNKIGYRVGVSAHGLSFFLFFSFEEKRGRSSAVIMAL